MNELIQQNTAEIRKQNAIIMGALVANAINTKDGWRNLRYAFEDAIDCDCDTFIGEGPDAEEVGKCARCKRLYKALDRLQQAYKERRELDVDTTDPFANEVVA